MSSVSTRADQVEADPVSPNGPDRSATHPPAPSDMRAGRGKGSIVRGVVSSFAVVIMLGGAGVAAWWLLVSAPEQETVPAPATVPTVDVLAPVFGDIEVTVQGFGEVVPAREASIAPEVVGRVIEVGATIEPGGFVDEGELLFRIDPADYEVAVAQAEADLAQAEADLELEHGRAIVAQQEWERFRDSLGDAAEAERSSALANREPQLRQAEARVQQAEAALDLARLQLQRTEVRAPFPATVIREGVEVGLRAGPDTAIVDLAGTDTFWVTASLPPSQGGRLTNTDAQRSIEATVSIGGGLGDRSVRRARLVRVLPDVDRAGRMVRVLVAVDDPLAKNSDADMVRLGDYASVIITAGTIGGVVELPREAVRENNELWVLSSSDTLRVLPVSVEWRNESTVVASAEFELGDRVITSFLSDPVPGQALRARENQ